MKKVTQSSSVANRSLKKPKTRHKKPSPHPAVLLQRFTQSPQNLSAPEIYQLQQNYGNRRLSGIQRQARQNQPYVQRRTQALSQNTPFAPQSRTGTRPTIQRTISSRARAAFATRLTALINQLRVTNQLSNQLAQEISTLDEIARSNNNWLQNEAPHAFRELAFIKTLLPNGTRSDVSPEKAIETDWPKESQKDFQAVSSTTFTPNIQGGSDTDGGGQFTDTVMQQLEQNEITNLQNGDTNLDVTVDARINLVLDEIDKAFHQNRAQSVLGLGLEPHQIVSVFIGPEWYFRRPDRPYTKAEMVYILKTFAAVSRVYPDMVIMPGTIIWAEGNSVDGWHSLTNRAPVFFNGRMLRAIDKADDCGDTSGLVDPSKFSQRAKQAYGSSRFDVGNLKFALDICVDHNKKRAQKEYIQEFGQKSFDKGGGYDVHLVTGAGQHAESRNTALKKGGISIASDSTGLRGAMKQVSRERFVTKKTVQELDTTSVGDGTKLTISQENLTDKQTSYLNKLKTNSELGDLDPQYLKWKKKMEESAKKPITVFHQAVKLQNED